VVAIFHGAYIAFVVGGFALVVVGAVRGWQWIRGFCSGSDISLPSLLYALRDFWAECVL
jgi:hypothetical protein